VKERARGVVARVLGARTELSGVARAVRRCPTRVLGEPRADQPGTSTLAVRWRVRRVVRAAAGYSRDERHWGRDAAALRVAGAWSIGGIAGVASPTSVHMTSNRGRLSCARHPANIPRPLSIAVVRWGPPCRADPENLAVSVRRRPL